MLLRHPPAHPLVRCPRCKADDDRVVDSRASADGRAIRRRRECLACFLRYTTYERIENTPLRVIKKSGERVRYERDRILHGMLRACEKLPVPVEELEAATARIDSLLQEEYDREVQSSVIGSLVMDELRKVHHVAYVRFASVYREFRDVAQFLDELRPILEGRHDPGAARSGEAPDSSPRPDDASRPPSSVDGPRSGS